MTDVKTEWASLEEHDDAMRNAIERRAYRLYELDEASPPDATRTTGFQAERQLTSLDIELSIGNDFLTAPRSVDRQLFGLDTPDQRLCAQHPDIRQYQGGCKRRLVMALTASVYGYSHSR